MSLRKHDIRVLKFGGTSVKNPQRLSHVAQIVAAVSASSKVIVVVSAMGQTTDSLVRLAERCSAKPNPRELDVLLACGEQQTIALLSIILSDLSVKVKSFTGSQLGIVTEANYGNAEIVSIDTDKINAAFDEHDVIVVAGFQGVTASGDITTLGRGGSDTSAVALAAAAGASTCEIYTDVDGIFTADPNLINGALQHQRISYEDCLEMAARGAQVIHPRAVECGRENSVTIRVRSVFNPGNLGTLIEAGEKAGGIVGIAATEGFSLLKVKADRRLLADSLLDEAVEAVVGRINLIEKFGRHGFGSTCIYLLLSLNRSAGEKLALAIGKIAGVDEARISFDITQVSVVGKEAPFLKLEQSPLDLALSAFNEPDLLIVRSELALSFYVEADKARGLCNHLHEALKPGFIDQSGLVSPCTRAQLVAVDAKGG